MSRLTDAELYLRGRDTLLASWEAYACGTVGAAVKRFPGVAAAVFPDGPERAVYNNALLQRDLKRGERAAALDAMESAYATAGLTRFAAWVHESDQAMRDDLGRRGYTLDTTTRAMGMALDDILLPRPAIELGPAARARHRADHGSGPRRARPRLPDREPAVDPDGRARVRRRGLPRPRPDPRIRSLARRAMMSEVPFVVGDADPSLRYRGPVSG